MSSTKNKKSGGHTQKAYEGIRQMLFHNEIVPGQKIAYRDLAERLGMSQTPVIQALKWLEVQGLVRHERHRGYYTEAISLQEVEEIYDFREQIELALLPAAMERIDPAGLNALAEALQAHLEASREAYLHNRLLTDKSFHLTLAALSGNRVQVRALGLLFDLLYLKYGGNILFSSSMEQAGAAHETLVDHMRARQLPEARKVLAGHIRQVKKHVLTGLSRMLQEKSKAGL